MQITAQTAPRKILKSQILPGMWRSLFSSHLEIQVSERFPRGLEQGAMPLIRHLAELFAG